MASRRANPAIIGAFVLGAVAIAVAAALILGSGQLFKESTRWVIYFDSSVMGLDVGAPVIFRGVTVGSVVEIQAYMDPTKKTFETPVYIELVRGTVRSPVQPHSIDSVALLKRWVKDDGLRAQLKSQSLITGKLYVDLDFHPDTPVAFVGLDPDVPEIPPIPTQMEEIERGLHRAMDRFSNLPLEEIADNLNGVLAGLKERIDDPKVASAIASLDSVLSELRTLLAKLDGSYGQLDADMRETLDQARNTLASIEKAAEEARGMVESGSPLQYQLITTLEEVTATVRSLRVLGESISADPNQLIFGRQSGEKP
jgi:paraquat-inducible protein B